MSAGRETPDKPGRLANAAIRLLAAAPVVFLPWFYGGVESSVQIWLLAGLAAALVLAVVAVVRGSEWRMVPVVMIPLVLAVVIGVMQVMPMPLGVLKRLAPGSAAVWKEQAGIGAAGDVSDQASTDRRVYGTISLYPASTRRDLALLVGALAMFLLGAQFFSQPLSLLGLLAVVAVNGAAIAFYGLALLLRPSTDAAQLANAGTRFATFVNRNHAAGLLNIALACALGLAIWSFARSQDRRAGRQEPGRLGVRAWLASLNGRKLFAFVLMALVSAGILCALSRGAWLAAISAAIITAAAAGLGKAAGRHTWTLLIAGIMGLALVCWIGKGELIPRRLNTVWDHPLSGRLAHWSDGLAAARDYLPLGSGLGTYRFSYLRYETAAPNVWFYHAENQYLEALAEQGILGLLLLLAVIGLAAWACRRLLLEPANSMASACGAAALFALVTQGVHSFFDFGLYLPANMCALALLMGGACGMAARLQTKASTAPAPSKRWLYLPVSNVSAAVGVTVLAMATGLACIEMSRAAAIDQAMRPAKALILADEAPSSAALESTSLALERALAKRSDDAEAQLSLAKLEVLSYRVKLSDRWRDQAKANDQAKLWQQTAPIELNGWMARSKREGRKFDVENLRQSAAVLTELAPAMTHLRLARAACPLLAETHLFLAEIDPLVSDHEEAAHLARMRGVTNDPRLLLESGMVEFQRANLDAAVIDWQRAIARSPQRLGDVLQFVAQDENSMAALERLLPDDPKVLVELARTTFAANGRKSVQQLLLKKASPLIATCSDEAERHYLEGTLRSLQDETPLAVREMSQAVKLRPEETTWRYELALLLQKMGDTAAAHEQAGLCLVQDPNNPRYEQLLRQLVRSQLTNHTTAQ